MKIKLKVPMEIKSLTLQSICYVRVVNAVLFRPRWNVLSDPTTSVEKSSFPFPVQAKDTFSVLIRAQ